MTQRRWREVYTPGNIAREIVHRLSRRPERRAPVTVPAPPAPLAYDDTHARQVGAFYDARHDAFLRVYGDVIQALRTRDVSDLLDQQAAWMALAPGEHLLDAGCGVGVPAMHFARVACVQVDAITISATQCADARARVERAGMTGRVTVRHGDYHRLRDYYAAGGFDVVVFLESFGHSRDTARLVAECWHVLKPGGRLYIKDLFVRVAPTPALAESIGREVARINEAYRYAVGDLGGLLGTLRAAGFAVSSLGEVELDPDVFEDLAISNQFQELTGLARIHDWDRYVFPVDFFQIACVKPSHDPGLRLDRHRLQHRLHARDHGGQ